LALHYVKAFSPQPLGVLDPFHPLCNDPQAQLRPEINGRAQDRGIHVPMRGDAARTRMIFRIFSGLTA